MAACGPSSPSVGAGGASTSEAPSDTSSGGAGGSNTSTPVEPDASSDGSTGDPPILFLVEPDGGGVSYECDFLLQDCPAGTKCNIWSNDGGSAWNATKCVPIAPDPDEVGEPCTVEGSGTSGLDTCVLGAVCWDVDPETLEGVCVAYCQGDASNPYCADPETTCEGRDILLCLPVCCPLEQNCVEGQGCYAIHDSFSCAPDASGDLGAFGDPCEYINACDPGLVCLGASWLPCEGAVGCCTTFCFVGSSACSELDPTMECVPWFEEGAAPPGFEHTGACVVPS
ncbi:ribulose phosphate epimerase [Paraliomyxa miuraensis]|uniref:ribulose phosphate epimerase n=1 Tax=Paraliomyxa miuraensis TaxID=376150 RepID=UPI002254A2BC|nr:ribulose phosphate epimerase [Paraliomyxa miuraensis]MCX4239962.1 ribulose phosphate epimerase [Paraliomyxa miuraensis]